MQFLSQIVRIVLIDLALSGDNAIVIGMAAHRLPPRQRRIAIVTGGAAAIVLRIALTAVAALLLRVKGLHLVGGLLLIWIGFRLLEVEEETHEGVKVAATMSGAIATILVADFIMSLDNVLGVAAAANGSLVLLVFGLLVSVPLVIAGSALILKLIERFPILIVGGGALLGYIAGEMFVREPVLMPWLEARGHWTHWGVPVACAVLVVAVAKVMERRRG